MQDTTQLVSINDAAAHLGVPPYHVKRLIDSGQLRSVVLVDTTSLSEFQETSA